MNEKIEQSILEHTSQDVATISKDVSDQFGQFVPQSFVMKVLGRNKRSFNVASAKDRASESLMDKAALMESMAEDLITQFNDKTLSPSERMKVAAELRQWTKLSIDLAGIHDEESDQLWVISSEWDTRPQTDPN